MKGLRRNDGEEQTNAGTKKSKKSKVKKQNTGAFLLFTFNFLLHKCLSI
jgi:hypothetical protein